MRLERFVADHDSHGERFEAGKIESPTGDQEGSPMFRVAAGSGGVEVEAHLGRVGSQDVFGLADEEVEDALAVEESQLAYTKQHQAPAEVALVAAAADLCGDEALVGHDDEVRRLRRGRARHIERHAERSVLVQTCGVHFLGADEELQPSDRFAAVGGNQLREVQAFQRKASAEHARQKNLKPALDPETLVRHVSFEVVQPREHRINARARRSRGLCSQRTRRFHRGTAAFPGSAARGRSLAIINRGLGRATMD